MPDVPILRASPPKLDSGRDHVAALSTTDGATHLFAANFTPPVGPGGGVDLGAVTNFNPQAQLVGMLRLTLMVAGGLPVQVPAGADGKPVPLPLIAECEGGHLVAMAHVVSFRYAGVVVARGAALLTTELPDGTRTVWHRLDGVTGWSVRQPWEDYLPDIAEVA